MRTVRTIRGYAYRKGIETGGTGHNRPRQAEPLEIILARAVKSGQPIKGGVTPPLYDDMIETGKRWKTDIRSDRFEIAQDLHDKWNGKGANEAAEVAKAEGSTTAGGEHSDSK